MGAEKEKSIGSGSIENPFAASGIVIKHEEGTKTTEIEEGKWEKRQRDMKPHHTKRPPNAARTKIKGKGWFRTRSTRQPHWEQDLTLDCRFGRPAVVAVSGLLEPAPAHELEQPLQLVRAP